MRRQLEKHAPAFPPARKPFARLSLRVITQIKPLAEGPAREPKSSACPSGKHAQRKARIRAYQKKYQKAYRELPKVKKRKKAYDNAYYSKPEVKARVKAYCKRPDVKKHRKAYNKAYYQRPEVKKRAKAHRELPKVKKRKKAYDKLYSRRPEVKAKQKAYRQRPEVKAKQKAYSQRPEVKARVNALRQHHKIEALAKAPPQDAAQKKLKPPKEPQAPQPIPKETIALLHSKETDKMLAAVKALEENPGKEALALLRKAFIKEQRKEILPQLDQALETMQRKLHARKTQKRETRV